MNKVILIGRLTRDPEIKYTPNQIAVCGFSLAVDRNYKSEGGNVQADFINCVAWRNTAEFVSKYFAKGNKMAAEGSMQTRSYEDKDGNTRYITEVVVDRVEFCESKKSASESAAQAGKYTGYVPIDDDDNVPF